MPASVHLTDDTRQGSAGAGHDTFGAQLIQARLEGLSGHVYRGNGGDRTTAVRYRQGPPLADLPKIGTQPRLEFPGADREGLRHVVIVTTYLGIVNPAANHHRRYSLSPLR